jgi:hypothetical protein
LSSFRFRLWAFLEGLAQGGQSARPEGAVQHRKKVALFVAKMLARGAHRGQEQPPRAATGRRLVYLKEALVHFPVLLMQSHEALFVLERVVQGHEGEVGFQLGMGAQQSLQNRGHPSDLCC